MSESSCDRNDPIRLSIDEMVDRIEQLNVEGIPLDNSANRDCEVLEMVSKLPDDVNAQQNVNPSGSKSVLESILDSIRCLPEIHSERSSNSRLKSSIKIVKLADPNSNNLSANDISSDETDESTDSSFTVKTTESLSPDSLENNVLKKSSINGKAELLGSTAPSTVLQSKQPETQDSLSDMSFTFDTSSSQDACANLSTMVNLSPTTAEDRQLNAPSVENAPPDTDLSKSPSVTELGDATKNNSLVTSCMISCPVEPAEPTTASTESEKESKEMTNNNLDASKITVTKSPKSKQATVGNEMDSSIDYSMTTKEEETSGEYLSAESRNRSVERDVNTEKKTAVAHHTSMMSRSSAVVDSSTTSRVSSVAQFITLAGSRRPTSMPRQKLATILDDIQEREGVIIETNEKDHSTDLDIVVRGRQQAVDRSIDSILLQLTVPDVVAIPSSIADQVLHLHQDTFRKLESRIDSRLIVSCTDRTVSVYCCNDKISTNAVRSLDELLGSLKEMIVQTLKVPHIYHPWIRGPYGKTLDSIRTQTDTLVHCPSLSDRLSDSIVVCGRKDCVSKAISLINESYEKLVGPMTSATFDLSHPQYVILRENANNDIDNILEKCNVSVELNQATAPSTTVTLRGISNSSIGDALSIINSLRRTSSIKIQIPLILQSVIKSKLAIIKSNFPSVIIDFSAKEDSLKINGNPAGVSKAKEYLDSTIQKLLQRFVSDSMTLDPQQQNVIYRDFRHKHRDYFAKHNVIVSRTKDSAILQLEGQVDDIQLVKEKLISICEQAKNEVSRVVSISRDYHGKLIGPRGSNISQIKNRFKVSIHVPTPEIKSNDISVEGNAEDVERCISHIQAFVEELKNSERVESISVSKSFHRLIIGAKGSKIHEIRNRTKANVDIPEPDDPSEIIRVRGRPDEVEQACQMIRTILEAFSEERVDLPAAVYYYIRQSKSFWTEMRRSFSQVNITQHERSTKSGQNASCPAYIILRGYRQDVQRCLEFVNAEVFQAMKHYAVTELHITNLQKSFLENNCRKMLSNIDTRLRVFVEYTPHTTSTDGCHTKPAAYVLYGKRENVDEAVRMLQDTLNKIGDVCEKKVKIPIKYHDRFRRRDELYLHQIRKTHFVEIIMPSKMSNDEDFVVRGKEESIANAASHLLELVKSMETEISMDIPCEFVPFLQNNLQAIVTPIESKCAVCIEFPTGSDQRDFPIDILDTIGSQHVIIHGQPEGCRVAAEMIAQSAPVEEIITVVKNYHPRLIGRGGQELQRIKRESGVSEIIFPDKENLSASHIVLRGTSNSVGIAREIISNLVARYNQGSSAQRFNNNRRRQRVDSNCVTLTMNVPKHLHPRIIGRGGTTINQLRRQFNVDVIMPEINSPVTDTAISVYGIRGDCEAAISEINNISMAEQVPASSTRYRNEDGRFTRNFDGRRDDGRRTDMQSTQNSSQPLQRGSAREVIKQAIIDANSVPYLIGRKGSNIKQIKEHYKVEVVFNADPQNPDVVLVKGWNEEQVSAAIDTLKEQSSSRPIPPDDNRSRQLRQGSFNEVGQERIFSNFNAQRAQRAQCPPDTSDLNEFPSF